MQGRYVPSLLAAIGEIVERHLGGLAAAPVAAQAFQPAGKAMPACPQCGGFRMVKVEGCNNCLDCGYSKCS
jgi:ribonucleoside-diphosphate reductase alpha chain